jgi:hypothetical protein
MDNDLLVTLSSRFLLGAVDLARTTPRRTPHNAVHDMQRVSQASLSAWCLERYGLTPDSDAIETIVGALQALR